MFRFLSPDGDGGGGGGEGGGEKKDAAYWEGEARKAFKDRDAAKKSLKDAESEGRVVSPEQLAKFKELEKAAADAEEVRARAAGEFDTLRKNLVDKHTTELADRETKYTALSGRFQDTVKRAAFGEASEYFGGSTAKTILDVTMAIDVLGRYVVVEDCSVDEDPRGYRVLVKTPGGTTISGRDGKPAPFAEAIGELINALPNKANILRGSGKTGSGSSGGKSDDDKPFDIRNLSPAQLKDPENLRKIAASQPPGQLVMGEAYQSRK